MATLRKGLSFTADLAFAATHTDAKARRTDHQNTAAQARLAFPISGSITRPSWYRGETVACFKFHLETYTTLRFKKSTHLNLPCRDGLTQLGRCCALALSQPDSNWRLVTDMARDGPMVQWSNGPNDFVASDVPGKYAVRLTIIPIRHGFVLPTPGAIVFFPPFLRTQVGLEFTSVGGVPLSPSHREHEIEQQGRFWRWRLRGAAPNCRKPYHRLIPNNQFLSAS